MDQQQFIYSYCTICNRMVVGAFSDRCPRCSADLSYTPPIIIYVPPYRFGRRGRSYDPSSVLTQAIARSFEEERDPEPKPASERTMERMRACTLDHDKEVCGICLENISQGEEAVVTGCCGKVTHRDCMEKTLVVISNCPFCRWSADS